MGSLRKRLRFVADHVMPDKHYLEGLISSGERIVLRVEGSTIYFMDVVKHDDIGRWPATTTGPLVSARSAFWSLA